MLTNKQIIFIKKYSQLTSEDLFNMRGCLDCFNWDEDSIQNPVIAIMLNSILNNESIGVEMASIILGSDEELEEEFLDEKRNTDVIVMSYGQVYIVLPEKIAIEFIIDWCIKYVSHPDIPALCKKLKEKYEL